jgi:hypothetical protein
MSRLKGLLLINAAMAMASATAISPNPSRSYSSGNTNGGNVKTKRKRELTEEEKSAGFTRLLNEHNERFSDRPEFEFSGITIRGVNKRNAYKKLSGICNSLNITLE